MADTKKTASDRAKDAADKLREGAGKVQDQAKRAGEAMKASGEKVVQGNKTIGMKMIDQAEANAREAFSAMRDAAKAKDLSEVMKIQGDYLREQGNRSVAQAREIGELIMQFGRDAIAPLRGGKD